MIGERLRAEQIAGLEKGRKNNHKMLHHLYPFISLFKIKISLMIKLKTEQSNLLKFFKILQQKFSKSKFKSKNSCLRWKRLISIKSRNISLSQIDIKSKRMMKQYRCQLQKNKSITQRVSWLITTSQDLNSLLQLKSSNNFMKRSIPMINLYR